MLFILPYAAAISPSPVHNSKSLQKQKSTLATDMPSEKEKPTTPSYFLPGLDFFLKILPAAES